MCRTCLGRFPGGMGIVNIFDDDPNYLGINIGDLLSDLRCPVSRGDSLPETICVDCLRDGKRACDTIRKFERSYQLLRDIKKKDLLKDQYDITTEGSLKYEELQCQVITQDLAMEGPSIEDQLQIKDDIVHFSKQEAPTDDQLGIPSTQQDIPKEGEFLAEDDGPSQFQVKNEPVEEDPSEEEDACEVDQIDYPVKSEDIEEYVLQRTATGQDDSGRKEEEIPPQAKPFECSRCSKRFKSARYLKEHQTIHTGERPFKCTHCPNSYRKKTCLQRHIQTYTGVRPFKCTHCPKTFVKDYDLQSHIRNYSGAKPYLCTVCSKTFATLSVLNVHARIHSGDKPFKCTHCSRDFVRRSSLLGHMQRHSKENPFTCSVCLMSFKVKSSLQRHMRIHEKN